MELNEEDPDQVRIKNYVIDPAHMQGTGEALFDFLADCIQDAVVTFGDESASLAEPIHLGFTFSFPCQQTSINAGKLLRWTKGFTATGVEGQDVVTLLQDALRRRDVHVHVEAVVNDTVGTLMARRRAEPRTIAGVILGTGTNGCYVEDLSRLAKWSGEPRTGRMCVNMEWGNFGRDAASRALLPLADADAALDAASLNPGEQIFEKLVGGMCGAAPPSTSRLPLMTSPAPRTPPVGGVRHGMPYRPPPAVTGASSGPADPPPVRAGGARAAQVPRRGGEALLPRGGGRRAGAGGDGGPHPGAGRPTPHTHAL